MSIWAWRVVIDRAHIVSGLRGWVHLEVFRTAHLGLTMHLITLDHDGEVRHELKRAMAGNLTMNSYEERCLGLLVEETKC